MSEPRATAHELSEVVPGVFHWRIEDERIGGFISAAHALRAAEGTILIDPLPLAPELLAGLGEAVAILVTAGTHQRSSWRYRRELGAPVWLPALSREIDEEPDRRYGDGDVLPGGLLAVFTPGAGTTQHTFLLDEPSVAFVPDLLVRPPDGPLAVIPEAFAYDVAQARRSLEALLERDFEVLCLGHGAPVTDDPHSAIRAALSL